MLVEIACEIYSIPPLQDMQYDGSVTSTLSLFTKVESLSKEGDFICELDLPTCRIIWDLFDFLCNESKMISRLPDFNTSLTESFFPFTMFLHSLVLLIKRLKPSKNLHSKNDSFSPKMAYSSIRVLSLDGSTSVLVINWNFLFSECKRISKPG